MKHSNTRLLHIWYLSFPHINYIINTSYSRWLFNNCSTWYFMLIPLYCRQFARLYRIPASVQRSGRTNPSHCCVWPTNQCYCCCSCTSYLDCWPSCYFWRWHHFDNPWFCWNCQIFQFWEQLWPKLHKKSRLCLTST